MISNDILQGSNSLESGDLKLMFSDAKNKKRKVMIQCYFILDKNNSVLIYRVRTSEMDQHEIFFCCCFSFD